MVKIENITPGAQVIIQRDGTERRVFLHQLITKAELESLQVIGGTVTYSIDEEVIEQKSSVEPQQSQQQLNLESIVSTDTTIVVEKQTEQPALEVSETPAPPVIVKPTSRTATKAS